VEEQFMRRALGLAARGIGRVEPNPPAGAVIVARDGSEIGAGWHRRFGGPHAEAEALADARARGGDVRGATVYVTLEPCCAFAGKKTPPCCEALIAAGVGRVVAAMADPDANVSGRGLAALRAAGIDVAVGLCGREASELLTPYVMLRRRGRPWVICKWAQTADGYLSLPRGAGRWITCEASRRRAHELRGICDGVCVGAGTVLGDDPLLTNRGVAGRQPARLVLDARLRTPASCRLAATASSSGPVIVATTGAAVATAGARADALRRAGVELLELPGAPGGGVALPALLTELGRRRWTRLLVEGGATLLGGFLRARLADELWVFISPRRLGAPGAGLPSLDLADVRRQLALREVRRERLGEDELHVLRVETEAAGDLAGDGSDG